VVRVWEHENMEVVAKRVVHLVKARIRRYGLGPKRSEQTAH
jgi:hypothetical protein